MNTKSIDKEVLEITPGEWIVDNKRTGAIVSNDFRGLILATVNYRPNWIGNAEAICKAINGTYGKGINPEGVEQMRKMLSAVSFNSLRVINELRMGKDVDIQKVLQSFIEITETALNNVKL